jgi:hypothetical protein
MSTDFRALCAELADALNGHTSLYEGHESELVARARTALAQPEPEGEAGELVKDLRECADSCTLAEKHGWARVMRRAAELLTRYARPTIKPVPITERPWEREGWCDEYGMCWRFDPCDRGWWSYGPILPSDGDPAPFTYLLPHHALPVPGAEAP